MTDHSTAEEQTAQQAWLTSFGSPERPRAVDGHALWAGPKHWLSVSVLAPQRPRLVLLCPKAVPADWWFSTDLQRDVGLIHAPFPADPRLEAIIGVVGGRGTPVVFVGDMDPVAIGQYLAARQMLAAATGSALLYGGINDSWLAAMRRSTEWPLSRLSIRLGPAETRLLRQLEDAVSLEELFGPDGAQLLRSGYKIELEAALNPAFHGARQQRWANRHLRAVAARGPCHPGATLAKGRGKMD